MTEKYTSEKIAGLIAEAIKIKLSKALSRQEVKLWNEGLHPLDEAFLASKVDSAAENVANDLARIVEENFFPVV